MKKTKKSHYSSLEGPLLEKASIDFPASADLTNYPFCLPILQNLTEIDFPSPVTFFVGENRTGKSTILEALADKIGFGPEGGSKNIAFKTAEEHTYTGARLLSDCITLSWKIKPTNGYFFRAESFFNVANHLDYMERECGGNAYIPYGGKSLHAQSHGESFLSFFQNRLGTQGFFIYDEPEAALSPQRQLVLLSIIHKMCTLFNSQFIIATHSPLLLAYPHATIYSCDTGSLARIEYADTEHYRITKNFLNNTDLYLNNLLKE